MDREPSDAELRLLRWWERWLVLTFIVVWPPVFWALVIAALAGIWSLVGGFRT